MNDPRSDLGPRLRSVLASQGPDLHNIPVRSELGAQVRRGFAGRAFVLPDVSQLEARLTADFGGQDRCDRLTAQLNAQARRDQIWQAYGGAKARRGGTRKIADLPRVCTSAQHDPPSMMVYEPGVWEHVCPDCGDRQIFTVTRPSL